MGLQKGGSAPQAPDPVATAQAQAAANKETAITQARLNQINEITPYGSAVYSPTGQAADGVDLYQRTITLSPEQQRISNLQQGLNEQLLTAAGPQLSRIEDIISQPFNLEGLPNAPVANEDTRRQVADAMFARSRQQLDPVFKEGYRDLETGLANQGFDVSSEAYRKALEDYNRSRGEAYNTAAYQAETGAGAEQSRLFGLEASARERALQERAFERAQPLNEFATVLGQSSGVNIPQFGAIPQTGVGGTDITGPTYASYQAQLDAYNAQQARQNSLAGSIFGVAGTALGGWLSDPDAKTDKKSISMEGVLKEVKTMPVEQWRYKGAKEKRIGPYADDWAEAFGGDGHVIDSQMAFGVSFAAIKALADKVGKLERAK